jgi:DNA-binding transcriptional ArsR family regulator
MGLTSFLKSIFTDEKTNGKDDFTESISVLKAETPTKIFETRIKPVRVPNIVDVGERLGLIQRDVNEIKNEMVSKMWFEAEYEDKGDEITNKLENINSQINSLEQKIAELNDLTKLLSNNLSNNISTQKQENTLIETKIPDRILKLIEKGKRIRYKDMINNLGISDPTLCKHLSSLLESNKIKRTKEGKAVFYATY